MSKRKLYNIYGKKQLNDKIENEGFKRITCSFYNYFNIADPEELRDPLYHEFEKINILGRVYIAKEGINAQISVPENAWDSFIALTQKYPFMKKVHIKKAIQEGLSFLKLKILIKKEIVAWGIPKEEYDMNHTGKHLNAKEFNDLITKEDTLLIDMRNSYESEVGKFKNAKCPKSKRSNELIEEVQKIIKNNEDKNIAMYCTGGIRCEKASSHLIKLGCKNVFQLNGGIIEYVKEIKEENINSKFIGKNFVFDDRMGERVTDDVISNCHLCDEPSDSHTNCNNDACHILFIICSKCNQKLDGCCSKECQDIFHLPLDKQKIIRKKFAKKFENKFRPSVSD